MKVATWTPVSSGGHRVSADCAGRQVYGKSWMQWILAGTGRVNHDIICSIKQCCNEDWKWTEDEGEDSLVSENRLKMKNLR